MYLGTCSAEELFNYPKRKFVFRLSTLKGYEMLVSPDSLEESMDWLDILNHHIEKASNFMGMQGQVCQTKKGI